jgi:hypothetical protein
MQDQRRLACRIAADFPIDSLSIPHLEQAAVQRFSYGMEAGHLTQSWRMAGEVILARAHDLVVSGLAQTRASNGDRRGSWSREEQLAVDTIIDNDLLRTNWVRYMVRRCLHVSGFDAFAYDGAVKTSLDLLK